MQDLIELVNLVQKTKFKTNGLLEIIVEPNTQMGQLYNAMARKSVQSDDDAKEMFPEFLKDPGRLATVKYQLKERLYDSVFLLNFKESTYGDRQKALLECSKKWSSSLILINKNARTAGISQLEQLLKHTVRFEFTELTIEILRVLRLHYGLCGADEKKYVFYESQLHECEHLWQAESRIESLYMDLIVRYVNTKSGKSAIAEKSEYLETAQTLMNSYSSFKIHLFARLIEVAIFDSRNDFARVEKSCEEALHFFGRKDYQSGLSLELFYYNLVICYLYSKQYSKGLEMIEAFSPLLAEGSFNWFKLKELHVYTCFHAGQYGEALDIYKSVVELPEFGTLPPVVTEIWKLMEAYFFYLAGIGAVGGTAAETILAHFRLGRFLNEVPTLSKDKRGMNVSILVVQFLCNALNINGFDAKEDQMEALNKYRTRYLNDKETTRSNFFLGILVQVVQLSHDLQTLEQKSKKFLDKLESTPWETINQNHEIEIIPYQNLWNLLLADLSQRKQEKKEIRGVSIRKETVMPQRAVL